METKSVTLTNIISNKQNTLRKSSSYEKKNLPKKVNLQSLSPENVSHFNELKCLVSITNISTCNQIISGYSASRVPK